MRIRSATALVSLAALSMLLGSTVAAEETKDTARILLVTGEDYKGHKWQETYPVLKAGLEKDPRLIVDVLADLKSSCTSSNSSCLTSARSSRAVILYK